MEPMNSIAAASRPRSGQRKPVRGNGLRDGISYGAARPKP